MLGFAVMLVGAVRADEISDLRKEQEKLYNQFVEMNNRLMQLESAQREQGQKITKIEETDGFALPEKLAWLEQLKIYGDFRYRYECRDREWKSDPKDDRHRIRARVGIQFRINEEMLFDFRIASGEFLENDDGDLIGSGDYVSGNVTLGEYWASKNAWIDRAYLAWTPKWADGVTLLFGKTYNPFYLAGKSDLIWDHDLNPEGIGIQYVTAWDKADELFLNAFAGTVQENGSHADKRMLGAQAGLVHTFDDSSRGTFGISYFDYTHVKGEEAILDDAFAGNSNNGTVYLYDYNLFEIFGEYAWKVGDMPVGLFGDYVVNTASGVSEDTGWLVGFGLNKLRKPGDWSFAYNYRDLEADAVFGAFTDSDFADGGTNARGHKFSLNYALAENTAFGVTYFCDEKLSEEPKEDYERIQLDLSVKF